MAANKKPVQVKKDDLLRDPDLAFVLRKAIRRDTEWTKTELSDVLIWYKTAVALIVGAAWGVWFQGAAAIWGGLAVLVSLTTLFVRGWLRLDEDEYGGALMVILDGAYVALAAFMVTWTLTFTALHGEILEQALQARAGS